MSSRHPELYRIPVEPGFVGGYDWKSLVLGLSLLFVTNVIATQAVATYFKYQRALGTPVLQAKGLCVYQPFGWAVWVWRYGSSSNPAVRKALLLGPLLVVIGATVTVIIVLSGNLRRTKMLSRNAEDIHGSARWATQEEIVAMGLLNTTQGVYVGGWYDPEETAGVPPPQWT